MYNYNLQDAYVGDEHKNKMQGPINMLLFFTCIYVFW
jgi:hypothetical protein